MFKLGRLRDPQTLAYAWRQVQHNLLVIKQLMTGQVAIAVQGAIGGDKHKLAQQAETVT